MSEIWILNASPVILLARIGRLDLLENLAKSLLVPEAVLNEIRAGEVDDPFTPAAVSFTLRLCVANLEVSQEIAHWDLGAGESQVLSRAIAVGACAVLDDLAARRCAAAHQVPVIGSLGILLRAKRKGILESVTPWIMKLQSAGMYLDDRLLHDVLRSVGEQASLCVTPAEMSALTFSYVITGHYRYDR